MDALERIERSKVQKIFLLNAVRNEDSWSFEVQGVKCMLGRPLVRSIMCISPQQYPANASILRWRRSLASTSSSLWHKLHKIRKSLTILGAQLPKYPRLPMKSLINSSLIDSDPAWMHRVRTAKISISRTILTAPFALQRWTRKTNSSRTAALVRNISTLSASTLGKTTTPLALSAEVLSKAATATLSASYQALKSTDIITPDHYSFIIVKY